MEISIGRSRRRTAGRRCGDGAPVAAGGLRYRLSVSDFVPADEPTWIDGKDHLADPHRIGDDLGLFRPLFDPCGTGSRSDLLVRTECAGGRSEEHTSELQSLTRLSYAVFCLNKNTHREEAGRGAADYITDK